MGKTVFLFPGQGAQYAGMGKDIYEKYPAAGEVFRRAAAVLGERFLEVIFSGPEEELTKTEYAQPAILTVSYAIFRVMEEAGYRPDAMAGLSLGEYTALTAAGVIAFEEALPLVRQRGRFMQEAVPAGVGSMTAVMGLPRDGVEEICRLAAGDEVVAAANYNCPGQVVISGHAAAVARAAAAAREAGAKKVVELKVSAPFHCSLLAPVEEQLARELDKVNLKPAPLPVVFNATATVLAAPEEIRQALIKQVSSPVLWEDSMRLLLKMGFDTFIELGPGKTLTGFMKRIDSGVYSAAVQDGASLETVREHLTREVQA